MTDTLTFRQHCIEGAQKFVQTALVIDNEAYLGPAPVSKPRLATRSSSSLQVLADAMITVGQGKDAVDGAGLPPGPSPAPPSPNTEQSPQSSPKENVRPAVAFPPSIPEGQQSHDLDAKSLMDAFLKVEIICGLYKPEPREQIVELSVEAAQHADIVILDWYLLDSNSQTAKEIVTRILKSDLDENGRLRLIAIYTAVPDLSLMASELLGFIEGEAALRDRFKLAPNAHTLSSADTRVSFINKPNVTGAVDVEIVFEKDLPGRLLEEFASITEGVLATFALNAIADVRRAAHHIVAIFRKELDGAYVAHRCSIPHPEDAKEFATEMVASEIRNVIAMNEVADHCMSAEVLASWIDHMANKGLVYSNHLAANAPAELVKKFIREGADAVQNSNAEQRRLDAPDQPPSKGKAIQVKTLVHIFYESLDEARERSLEFARKDTFKREAFGRTRFPKDWRPVLTLGAVLKAQRVRPEPKDLHELYADLPSDYIVCVQPRCDSLRLENPTSFPFQAATYNPAEFNLVVKDDAVEGVELLVSYKPRDAVMLTFKPEQPFGAVRASLDEEGRFFFKDERGRIFLWLGDVKDLKAQRDASLLAANVHSVAIDEFEWLRLAAKGEIKS